MVLDLDRFVGDLITFIIRHRVCEGVTAVQAREQKSGRSRIMTPVKLRYTHSLMVDRTCSIPDICRELGDPPRAHSTHYLAALPVHA